MLGESEDWNFLGETDSGKEFSKFDSENCLRDSWMVSGARKGGGGGIEEDAKVSSSSENFPSTS